MTYRITGLDPTLFAALFGLSDHALAERSVVRIAATSRPGFPCRITLEDAEPGETLLLLNHVSHACGPYRASHAIFVREGEHQPAVYENEPAPAMRTRPLSLRGFDAAGMMVDASLAQPGEADQGLRTLFDRDDVVEVHVHNAIRGCFAARAVRA